MYPFVTAALSRAALAAVLLALPGSPVGAQQCQRPDRTGLEDAPVSRLVRARLAEDRYMFCFQKKRAAEPGPKGSGEAGLFASFAKAIEDEAGMLARRDIYPSRAALTDQLVPLGKIAMIRIARLDRYFQLKQILHEDEEMRARTRNTGKEICILGECSHMGPPEPIPLDPALKAEFERISTSLRFETLQPRWFWIEEVTLFVSDTDDDLGESLRRLDDLDLRLEQARNTLNLRGQSLDRFADETADKLKGLFREYTADRARLRRDADRPLFGPDRTGEARLREIDASLARARRNMENRALQPDTRRRARAEADRLMAEAERINGYVSPELQRLEEYHANLRSNAGRNLLRAQAEYRAAREAVEALEKNYARELDRLAQLRERAGIAVKRVDGTWKDETHTVADWTAHEDTISELTQRLATRRAQLDQIRGAYQNARDAHVAATLALINEQSVLDARGAISNLLQTMPQFVSQALDTVASARMGIGGIVTTAGPILYKNLTDPKFFEPGAEEIVELRRILESAKTKAAGDLTKLPNKLLFDQPAQRDFATRQLQAALRRSGGEADVAKALADLKKATDNIDIYRLRRGVRSLAETHAVGFLKGLARDSALESVQRWIADAVMRDALSDVTAAAFVVSQTRDMRMRTRMLVTALEADIADMERALGQARADLKRGKVGVFDLSRQGGFYAVPEVRFTLVPANAEVARALRASPPELSLGPMRLDRVGSGFTWRLPDSGIFNMKNGPDRPALPLHIQVAPPR